MKTIRELNAPTPGLADYLACVGDDTDWAEFRSHGSGASYSELRDALTENQHGLCAYCEVALRDRHRQVEHVIPRSDIRLGEAKALDIANMLASCMGGTLEVPTWRMKRNRRVVAIYSLDKAMIATGKALGLPASAGILLPGHGD